jgi:hypothetical protein
MHCKARKMIQQIAFVLERDSKFGLRADPHRFNADCGSGTSVSLYTDQDPETAPHKKYENLRPLSRTPF